MPTANDVLTFWFDEAGPKRWFKQSDDFDTLCKERFGSTLESARQGECWEWRSSPEGRCAEIIVLDQLSRNIFRHKAAAFSQDSMALTLAQLAVACGDDQRMSSDQRYFTYMPYMHSESLKIHDEAMGLFQALGNKDALRFEIAHRDVIEQFGRYPGRNAALGRQSTAAEQQYLKTNAGF